MTELIIYLLKAAVVNAVILGFFYFTMRKTNRFSLMRVILLTAMVLPFLLPLIPIPGSVTIVIPQETLLLKAELPVTALRQGLNDQISHLPTIYEFVYYVIAVTFIIGVLFSVTSIIKKKLRSARHSTNFGDVLLEGTVESPFSFFEWVFISKCDLDHPQLNMLLKHEFCHVRKLHSLDRIISGIFRSVLWFSPFAHITAKRLIEVHEYQADANVLQSHVTPSEYSDLVLSFYLNNLSTRSVSNNFSFHIKKRIAMINNVNIGRLKVSRIITGLLISFSFIITMGMVKSEISKTSFNSAYSDQVSIASEHDTIAPSPVISLEWLKERNTDEIDGLNGKVIVGVTIDHYGNAKDIEITQSAGVKLDEWALRMIKNVKSWIPASVDGKDIDYRLEYPFNFESPDKIELINSGEGIIFEIPDNDTIPPQFPGGNDAMVKYLIDNVKYPNDARLSGTKGTVYLQFQVQENGKITDVKVVKGVSASIDNAALNAVKKMPEWIPATINNKPVPFIMAIPIKFSFGIEENEPIDQKRENEPADIEKKNFEKEKENMDAEHAIIDKENEKIDAEKESAERERIIAEQDEITAEQDEITAEQDRITAQQDKMTVEQDRITAEQDRIAAEQDKIAAKQDKIAAKQDKIAAKQDKIAAKQDKKSSIQNEKIEKERNKGN